MSERVHNSPNLIYSAGTQVVTRKPVQGSSGQVVPPAGAVGVIVKSPQDRSHAYRVRFTDGFEAALHHDNLTLLAEYKQGSISDAEQVLAKHGLFDRVIFRCVIGSRAYGLDDDNSDIRSCLPRSAGRTCTASLRLIRTSTCVAFTCFRWKMSSV